MGSSAEILPMLRQFMKSFHSEFNSNDTDFSVLVKPLHPLSTVNQSVNQRTFRLEEEPSALLACFINTYFTDWCTQTLGHICRYIEIRTLCKPPKNLINHWFFHQLSFIINHKRGHILKYLVLKSPIFFCDLWQREAINHAAQSFIPVF